MTRRKLNPPTSLNLTNTLNINSNQLHYHLEKFPLPIFPPLIYLYQPSNLKFKDSKLVIKHLPRITY